MDVVTLAAIGLGIVAVAAVVVAAWQWSAHRRVRAALAAAEAEAETLRRHDAQLHEAFEIYRERHRQLTDRVRPRRLSDEQRNALRMHLRELRTCASASASRRIPSPPWRRPISAAR